MSSRPLVILGIVIIFIAIAASIGYLAKGSGGLTGVEDQIGNDIASSSSGQPVGTTTSPEFYGSASPQSSPVSSGPAVGVEPYASSTFDVPMPASGGQSAVDTSSWLIHVDNAAGYSVEYPSNMMESAAAGVLTLVFPKSIYFHWPLEDNAKITVYATTTCPSVISGAIGSGPQNITLNGLSFTRNIGTDVGAGQLYTEVAYDTYSGGKCYRVDFFDHGTNGAGFYVDDVSLIQRYDAQHATDMQAAFAVMNGIVGSLKIISAQ
ncbi:MAG: hypothetical protein KGI49_01755 [Patescibacteria group bacterium]|nr:hypothetical protein [Patescibacteria group bacterium]